MSSKTEKRRVHPIRLTLIVILTGVGCLVGAVVVFNTSPRLLLGLLGLERLGYLADGLPPQQALIALDGQPLDHVDVLLPPQVVEPLTLKASQAALGDPLMGDASTPGTTRYLVSMDEAGVNELLWELIVPEGLHNDRYRDVTIDLKPGGLIVYADVDLGVRWQRMGLLLLQDPHTLTLSPAGVMLKGNLYGMPEAGSLARLILPAGRQAQRALYALMIVGPLPGEARVEAVHFFEDRLQVQARATYAVRAQEDTGWQVVEPGVELRQVDVPAATGQATERLSMVRLDPAAFHIRVHYDPNRARTVSAWGATLDALLVVNGSFFAAEREGRRETIGLLISDGERWGAPLPDYAGMLAVTSAGDVSVRWLRQRPYDPEEPLTQAIQSFPVLVQPGGRMGFPADADDGEPARRTVVAQDHVGNILFLVAPRGRLSLYDLAVFLTESDLGVDVALNLDGGGSTGMWLPPAHAQLEIDSFTPVPSVIAAERR